MRFGDPQRTMLIGTVLSILLICVTPFFDAIFAGFRAVGQRDLALTFLQRRPAIRLCAGAAQQRVCELSVPEGRMDRRENNGGMRNEWG
jgi:hypothetical protein